MPYDEDGEYYDNDDEFDYGDYDYDWDDWDYARAYTFGQIIDSCHWSKRLRLALIVLRVRIKIGYVRRAARHTYLDAYYKITKKHDPRTDIPF
jgi:hypothetical protein